MPTLPTVALRVMEVTSNPGSSASDLMEIIGPDVSLTAKILKIANSPDNELFYGDIVTLSKSFGIDWKISDLRRFQDALAESMKKEADAMKLFF